MFKLDRRVGPWSFVIGLVIAVAAGFFSPANATAALALGVIGIIVGLLNVSAKETATFLLAAIAFLAASAGFATVLKSIPAIGAWLPPIVDYFLVFIGTAAAVVALKALYETAKK